MNVQTDIGDWIQTFSGQRFSFSSPHPNDVRMTDIAHGLSNLCRYAGQCDRFYSVAEHAVHVSKHLEAQGHDVLTCFVGLHHDDTEAYCVDVPRPLKKMLPQYAEIEERVWLAIAAAFGIPPDMPDAVKWADNAVLLAEKEQILKEGPRWSITGEPANIEVLGLLPLAAEQFFLDRHDELIQRLFYGSDFLK